MPRIQKVCALSWKLKVFKRVPTLSISSSSFSNVATMPGLDSGALGPAVAEKWARTICALFLALHLGSSLVLAATREEVLAATLAPYSGESIHGVDTSTLTGKVMCGYQGWFNCDGDGAHRSWVHWTKGKGIPSPANIKVDLWPDVSELGADERFDTAFRHTDGTPAQVFSSFKQATVPEYACRISSPRITPCSPIAAKAPIAMGALTP